MVSRLKREIVETLKAVRTSGTFGSNLAITTAGTGSAYLIGFLLSPLIARIYQPEAYGLYALFNAFVANLSIVSTLDYVNALILPRSKKEFISLLQLSIVLIFIVFVLSSVILILFGREILQLFNANELGGLVYFVPIIVAFIGINRCLDFWNIREKEFKQGAKAKVVAIVGAKVLTLIYGLLSKGNPFGFIVGELLGKPITAYAQVGKVIKKDLFRLWNLSKKRIRTAAINYKNYPIYNLPANTLITFGIQLPVYLLSLFFNASTVGHFSLAISLINAPAQVVGLAFAQVFFQKADETNKLNPENLKIITKKLFRRLTYIGVLPYVIITIYGADLFVIIFGSNWEVAGNFASYLSLMAYTNFISVSICALFRVIREEKLQFYIVSSGALILAVGLLLSLTFQTSEHLVIVYSAIGTLLQLVLMSVILMKIKIRPFPLLLELILVYIAGVFAAYFIKALWIHFF